MAPVDQQGWKTVRVFISSTFRDMQAERDHLVRFVFPRLREELLKRRVHLVDVDLRWGVTTDQDALTACREIIDECRPRFICLLGGRYGWVPPGQRRSITADEIHYAALDRLGTREYRFFYFRDPQATAAIPAAAAVAYGYREAPSAAEIAQHGPLLAELLANERATRLAQLKGAVIAAGFTPFVYPARWDGPSERLVDLDALGERVYADLLWSVDDEFGAAPAPPPNEFAAERAAIEAFVAERIDRYVVGARAGLLAELTRFADGDEQPNVLALVGDPGLGKSALLSRFYRDYRDRHADALIIPHLIGVSSGSTSVRRMVRRLCYELAAAPGAAPVGAAEDIPLDLPGLIRRFAALLEQTARHRRVILLIDALNQLDPTDAAHELDWLPIGMPRQVRVIVSSLEHPALEALRRQNAGLRELRLAPLGAADQRAIVEGFLSRYQKRLSDEQLAALLAKAASGSPLYLLIALEELRTLGTFEAITARIRDLPGAVQPLFQWILRERLAGDTGFRDAAGRLIGGELARRFVSYLGLSRRGLAQAELAALIAPGDPQGNLAALQRLLRPYLMWRGDLLDFYHGQLRDAVAAQFLADPGDRRVMHVDLAACFRRLADPGGTGRWAGGDPRPLSELAHHLLQAGGLAELQTLYADPAYLAAACAAGGALPAPDDSPQHEGVINLLTDLQLAIAGIDRGQAPLLLELLQALFDLLVERGDLLRRFPRAVGQEIANYLDGGRPATAELAREAARRSGGLRIGDRTLTAPAPPGHTARVSTLAVAPDGRHFLSGGYDGYVGYWQIDRPRPLWLIGAHKARVTRVAFASDGRRALSSGADGVVMVWDVELAAGRQIFGESLHPIDRGDPSVDDDAIDVVGNQVTLAASGLGRQLLGAGSSSESYGSLWPEVLYCGFADDETILVIRGGSLRRIELATGRDLYQTPHPASNMERGSDQRIDDAPAAHLLVMALTFKTRELVLVDTLTGRICQRLPLKGPPEHVAISADGRYVLAASAQGRLECFDRRHGTVADLPGGGLVRGVCRGEGGTFFVYDYEKRVRRISRDPPGETVVALTAPPANEEFGDRPIRHCAAGLLIGARRGEIQLIDGETGAARAAWAEGRALIGGAIFPDRGGAIGLEGENLAGEQKLGSALIFFDQAGGSRPAEGAPHGTFISGVAAINAAMAISVDRSGTAAIWEGQALLKSHRVPNSDFTCCAGWAAAALGVGGTRDDTVVLAGRGAQVRQIPLPSNRLRARSGIAALAASGPPLTLFVAYANGEVRCTGAGDWGDFVFGLGGSAAALSSDSTWAACGTITGQVVLWRCADGTKIGAVRLHRGETTDLAFAPDNRVLYSIGADRMIVALELPDLRPIAASLLPARAVDLLVEHGGLSVMDSGGNIYRFTYDPAAPDPPAGDAQRR